MREKSKKNWLRRKYNLDSRGYNYRLAAHQACKADDTRPTSKVLWVELSVSVTALRNNHFGRPTIASELLVSQQRPQSIKLSVFNTLEMPTIFAWINSLGILNKARRGWIVSCNTGWFFDAAQRKLNWKVVCHESKFC